MLVEVIAVRLTELDEDVLADCSQCNIQLQVGGWVLVKQHQYRMNTMRAG